MSSRTLCTVLGACLAWNTSQGGSVDPAELVQGVSQIVSSGLPGPVHPMSQAWWPIASGDQDASFPSLFVAAREFGAGRVVIVGHDGVVTGTDLLDNGPFMLNVMTWLDVTGLGEIRYTTGHAEWITGQNLGPLAQLLEAEGMTVSDLGAPIDTLGLAGVSVLIVGNAWQDFTSEEIEAVRQWVVDGGGLLLPGLGWSWEPYHPGTTIEDYPMMEIAAPYEVRWLRNGITDPSDSLDGSAIFHTFYPDIEIATTTDAIQALQTIHAAHEEQLSDDLEADADLRFHFVRAHQTLAIPSTEFPESHEDRQVVYDAYASLVATWPGFYARGFSVDQSSHPTSAWVRERSWRTWRDTLALTDERKDEMIALGQFTDGPLAVFDDFGVLLLDNDRLIVAQTDIIHDYLSLVPGDLYEGLRAISVVEFLGEAPFGLSLSGMPYQVNIFGMIPGSWAENQFPPDVAPVLVDVFSIVLAHELNHVVDAKTIGGSAELAARRDQLIADAGADPLNYLRSMFPPGFFVDNPQEFFASIANQWFTESEHTLELGLVRFDDGRPDPINQALFVADVYAQGALTTSFYTTDTNGDVTRSSTLVGRDAVGRLAAIRVGSVRYEFDLDTEGRVTAYATAPASDLDGNGNVATADLLILLGNWGSCADFPETCATDLDGDGVTRTADLLQLLADWGTGR